MFSALLYKEWLKIRWTYLSLSVIILISVVYIFLTAAHSIEINGTVAYWSYVIYLKYPFYSDLHYIPFIIGVVLALVQFYPEIDSGRLKLTLHLPVKENKILLQMILIGGCFLIALIAITLLAYSIISSNFFPKELTYNSVYILLPAFLAGLISYFSVAVIMIEPVWRRRIPQMIFFGGLISILIILGDYTNRFLIFYLFACLFIVMTILLSGYYFKRGIK